MTNDLPEPERAREADDDSNAARAIFRTNKETSMGGFLSLEKDVYLYRYNLI